MEDKNVKLTNKQKNSHEKKWYKEELDALDSTSFDNNSAFTFTDGRSEYHNRMKLNYNFYTILFVKKISNLSVHHLVQR